MRDRRYRGESMRNFHDHPASIRNTHHVSQQGSFCHCIAVSSLLIWHFDFSRAMVTKCSGLYSIMQEKSLPGGVRRCRKISSSSAAAQIRRAMCVASRVTFSLMWNNTRRRYTWPAMAMGNADVQQELSEPQTPPRARVALQGLSTDRN